MDNTNNGMVMIPIKRYEELLKTETRVTVLVERYMHSKYLKDQDVLFTLGTDLAVELAMDIVEKEENQRKEWAKVAQESQSSSEESVSKL